MKTANTKLEKGRGAILKLGYDFIEFKSVLKRKLKLIFKPIFKKQSVSKLSKLNRIHHNRRMV
tara:strand:+ start:1282 stop:1470 length:189 start_codon:yes stop_codon:yes gene_type:complete